jgi:DNA-binding transcriptional MerR regulator
LKENTVEQGFTIDQVLELLNHQSVENQKHLLLAIQELKKPSPEEQAKIDREHAKLKERAATAVKLAMAEEKAKENAAKYCPHGTTHKGTKIFTHQWRAQIHMPAGEKPYYLPRCTQCGSTWDRVFGLSSPKIIASPEQIGNPIDMDQWSMDDIKRVVEWARLNPVEELQAV